MINGAAAEFDYSKVTFLNKQLLYFAERDYPKQTKDFLNKTMGNEGRRIFRQNAKKLVGKRTGQLHRRIDKRVKKGRNKNMVLRIYSKVPYAAPVEFGHDKVIRGKKYDDRVKGKFYAWATYKELSAIFPDRVEKFLDEYLKGFET